HFAEPRAAVCARVSGGRYRRPLGGRRGRTLDRYGQARAAKRGARLRPAQRRGVEGFVFGTRCSAFRAAPQSRDLCAVVVWPRISSAPRRKRGALRSIRGTRRTNITCASPSWLSAGLHALSGVRLVWVRGDMRVFVEW